MHWFILDFAAGSHETRASVVTFLMPSSYESYRWEVSREPRCLGQKGSSVPLAQNGSDQFELKRTAPSSSVRLLTTDEVLRGPSDAPSYCGIGKGSRPDCSQCAQRYLFVTWVRSVTLANGSSFLLCFISAFDIADCRTSVEANYAAEDRERDTTTGGPRVSIQTNAPACEQLL